MWPALFVLGVVYVAGLFCGAAITWRRVNRDAKQIIESGLEARLPRDLTGLVGLVANRMGTRFTALVAGDGADSLLVAVAANKAMTKTDELMLLGAATLDLHESVMREVRFAEAKQHN